MRFPHCAPLLGWRYLYANLTFLTTSTHLLLSIDVKRAHNAHSVRKVEKGLEREPQIAAKPTTKAKIFGRARKDELNDERQKARTIQNKMRLDATILVEDGSGSGGVSGCRSEATA